jgi:hypothetical protein
MYRSIFYGTSHSGKTQQSKQEEEEEEEEEECYLYANDAIIYAILLKSRAYFPEGLYIITLSEEYLLKGKDQFE